MKQLQNDFTTPEQSKRLLELGVPADSADCLYSSYTSLRGNTQLWHRPRFITKDNGGINWDTMLYDCETDSKTPAYLPCWSAGRLMQIINYCVSAHDRYLLYMGLQIYKLSDIIGGLMIVFEEAIKHNIIYFQNLED